MQMKGRNSMKPTEQGCVESPGEDGGMDKRHAGSEAQAVSAASWRAG